MTLKVLIVEDSPIAGELLRRRLERDLGYRVVGCLASGVGVTTAPEYELADAVILDLLLPERSGLSLVRELARDKVVVIVSDAERDSPLVREALAQGARGFVSKRELAGTDHEALRTALSAALRASAGRDQPKVAIVIGSTGAIEPLRYLFSETREAALAFVVLQHLAQGGEERFAQWLSTLGRPAHVAATGMTLSTTHVLTPPSARHMLLAPPDVVELDSGPPVGGHRPAAALLLRSAAFLGARLITVTLSGLGSDGSEAMPELIARGASCLVQLPADCVAPSMPQATLDAAPAARSLPLAEIARALRTVGAHAR